MKTTTKVLTMGFAVCMLVFALQFVGPSLAYAVGMCTTNADCNFINGTAQYWTGAQTCRGNQVWQDYFTWTCINPNSTQAYCASSQIPTLQTNCSNGCHNGSCIAPEQGSNTTQYNYNYNYQNNTTQYQNYIQHSYLWCSGNNVYWFDSYGNKQDLYQACYPGQSCTGNSCGGTSSSQNIYTQTNYTAHSFKGCLNNVSYWYDSTGAKQDVYQNCNTTGQTCQEGACTGAVQTYTPPPATATVTTVKTVTTPAYCLQYETKCKDSDVYWYDSKGAAQKLFKSCSDSNSCTADSCGDGDCKNELKCDGSTCQVGSGDYVKYCGGVAAVSENPLTSFFKKWYIWFILAVVLVFLFIVVFRRLSSNT